MERARRVLGVAHGYRTVFQILVLGPSLVGIALALARLWRRPELALVAWQLVNYMVVAAIFFGTIRLRTPYDPYAIILAAEVWGIAILWWIHRRARAREMAGR